MCDHLFNCLENNRLTRFPNTLVLNHEADLKKLNTDATLSDKWTPPLKKKTKKKTKNGDIIHTHFPPNYSQNQYKKNKQHKTDTLHLARNQIIRITQSTLTIQQKQLPVKAHYLERIHRCFQINDNELIQASFN